MSGVFPPDDTDDWFALTNDELPIAAAYDWAVRPHCGAVVLFSGTVRDHADGRTGVTSLEYEAYETQVVTSFAAIGSAVRTGHPTLGRLAILHRVGVLGLGESSVVVVASSPHRAEAFEAARFCIDTLKQSAPIWKRETWEGGVDWGTRAHDVVPVAGAPASAPGSAEAAQ